MIATFRMFSLVMDSSHKGSTVPLVIDWVIIAVANEVSGGGLKSPGVRTLTSLLLVYLNRGRASNSRSNTLSFAAAHVEVSLYYADCLALKLLYHNRLYHLRRPKLLPKEPDRLSMPANQLS